ncbi:unnamed protein product [Cylindrotheca closterium]|uniref:Uncharacterized protein n=1 Tax=Cylindrotheca closterium TaxID=2856 RepID=A0AAD2CMR1_9STRA|nr:unnamed protein product [Cylindrotheca closterium]
MEDEDAGDVDEDVQPLSTAFVAILYGKALINLVASFACFFFIAAMLSKPTIRNNSYNLYVVFMIFPDGINTLFRVLTNVFLALNHGVHWYPPGFHYLDLFFWMFYYVCNFYLNVFVTFEINKLVEHCHRGRRIPVLKLQRTRRQIAGVYFFSACIASLMVLPFPFALYHIIDDRRGKGRTGSGPNGWYSFDVATYIFLLIMAVPVSFVLLVAVRMWIKKLLPKRGRLRVLTLFFLRVIILFIVFYVPATTLTYRRSNMEDEYSGGAFALDTVLGVLAACQALTTLYMIWLKYDIRVAVKETWNKTFGRIICCRCTSADRSGDVGVVHISGMFQAKKKSRDQPQHLVPPLPKKKSSLIQKIKDACSVDDDFGMPFQEPDAEGREKDHVQDDSKRSCSEDDNCSVPLQEDIDATKSGSSIVEQIQSVWSEDDHDHDISQRQEGTLSELPSGDLEKQPEIKELEEKTETSTTNRIRSPESLHGEVQSEYSV